MITLFGQTYAWNAPEILLIGGAVLLLAALLILILRAAGRSATMAAPLMREMGWLGQRVQALGEGQERLAGGLHHVSEAQTNSQTAMLQLMEKRLAEVQRAMGESLHGTATRTAHSLGELQQRLLTIDKAQANIEKLSGNVLNLQDILANKQARGAFGEIQLNDIVQKALPSDAYTMQATLSNGKRADCLIHLPNPPGPIVIDAKFPLEAYEALRRADNPACGDRGAGATARGCPRPYQSDLGKIHPRRRNRRWRADVPALGSRLCRTARQLPRSGARWLYRTGLDRLAHHLHGDAEHHARGAERCADA